MTELAEDTREFVPLLWRDLGGGHESGVAFSSIKSDFWRPFDALGDGMSMLDFDLAPDILSEGIFSAREKRATTIRDHREGHPEHEYDVMLIAKMEAKTPQFNLRNVGRVTREVEVGYIEWSHLEMPDRHGYEADLAEVRTARHEAVVPDQTQWAGTTSREVREQNDVVFWENDWEQWYGDDKRREAGSLWRYRPEGGGKRTRPWEKIRITEHKFWKGRLITEDF